MAQDKNSGGAGQIIALVVIAVILGIGYVALDFYSDGEKNKAIAESRGVAQAALTGLDSGATARDPALRRTMRAAMQEIAATFEAARGAFAAG